MFQENDSWWDLLCVLDLPNGTGTVKSIEEKKAEDARNHNSSKGGPSSSSSSSAVSSSPQPSSVLLSAAGPASITGSGGAGGAGGDTELSHAILDHKFILMLLSAVQFKLGEDWVRQKFHDFTNNIVTQAQALKEVKAIRDRFLLESAAFASSSSSSGLLDHEGSSSSSSLPPASPGAPLHPSSGVLSPSQGQASSLTASFERYQSSKKANPRLKKSLGMNFQRALMLSDSVELQTLVPHPWLWSVDVESPMGIEVLNEARLFLAPAPSGAQLGSPIKSARSTDSYATPSSSRHRRPSKTDQLRAQLRTSVENPILAALSATGLDSEGEGDFGDDDDDADDASSSGESAADTAADLPDAVSSGVVGVEEGSTAASVEASTSSSIPKLRILHTTPRHHRHHHHHRRASHANDAVDGFLLKAYIVRLQVETGLHSREVQCMLADLESSLTNEVSVQALVSLMPESQGGLHPVASCLFSANPAVKKLAAQILVKVSSFPSTRPAVNALNGMISASFERCLQKMQDGSLDRDIAVFEGQQVDALTSALQVLTRDQTMICLSGVSVYSVYGHGSGAGGQHDGSATPGHGTSNTIDTIDMIP